MPSSILGGIFPSATLHPVFCRAETRLPFVIGSLFSNMAFIFFGLGKYVDVVVHPKRTEESKPAINNNVLFDKLTGCPQGEYFG